MSGTSNKTQVIPIRLPLSVVTIAARRVRRQTFRPKTISEYLRDILVLQLTRSHHKKGDTHDSQAPGTK